MARLAEHACMRAGQPCSQAAQMGKKLFSFARLGYEASARAMRHAPGSKCCKIQIVMLCVHSKTFKLLTQWESMLENFVCLYMFGHNVQVSPAIHNRLDNDYPALLHVYNTYRHIKQFIMAPKEIVSIVYDIRRVHNCIY